MRSRWASVIAIAPLAIVVGCGSSAGEASKSPATIATDARAAADAASSVHVKGSISAQGQAVPVDLRITATGAVGTGSFGGATVQLIRSGSNIYVRGAQQVFGSFLGARAAAKADDHWIEIPASLPQLAQLADLTGKSSLLQTLLTSTKPAAKHGTRVINGVTAVAISGFGSDGSGQLLVATSGKPYPVQLAAAGSTLTFSDWNSPVTVSAPTDVVPLTALTG